MTGAVMYSYTIIQWLFSFYFYCFGGWCFESAYVSIRTRKLTNRGFMRGPFLPLYGSGATMMLVVSMPFQDNIFLVYLAGCVGATILEYITGVTMDALFKMRYWDYSEKKFNFRGQICLSSTLFWGCLTILTTELIQVQVERLMLAIPGKALTIGTIVVTIVVFADFALSFKAAIDLRDLLMRMEKTKDELVRIQNRLNAIIAVAGESLGERKEALAGSVEDLKHSIEGALDKLKNLAISKPSAYLESVKDEVQDLRTKYAVSVEIRKRLSRIRDFFQRDMILSNPTMTSEQYKESLDELKQEAEKKQSEE